MRITKISTQIFNNSSTFKAFTTSSFSLNKDKGTFPLSRKFDNTETYHPRDLNEENYKRYKEQQKFQPKTDYFALANLDPLKQYKNKTLLSGYITSLGKIKPRTETGLSQQNQRRLSKAIKRARAMGFIAVTYKHGQNY